MLSLEAIPAKTRLQIFFYLRPRTYPIRLGRNPNHHAKGRTAVPPPSGAKAFPAMNACTSVSRVCHLFDQEFTSELYPPLHFQR